MMKSKWQCVVGFTDVQKVLVKQRCGEYLVNTSKEKEQEEDGEENEQSESAEDA